MASHIEVPTLDPEVWSRVPPHLLERMLACIPLGILVTLRVVCKLWNSVVIPNASRIRKIQSPASTATLIFSVRMSDPKAHVQPLWLDGGDAKVSKRRWGGCICCPARLKKSLGRFGHRALIASEGGLLFFVLSPKSIWDEREPTVVPDLLVCNPFTGRHKFLRPPFPDSRLPGLVHDELLGPVLGVVFNADNESYRIVVVTLATLPGGSSMLSYTMVYDSRTSSWRDKTGKGALEHGSPYRYRFVSRHSARSNGIMYWYLECLAPTEGAPMTKLVLQFDVEKEILNWREVAEQSWQRNLGTNMLDSFALGYILSTEGDLLHVDFHPSEDHGVVDGAADPNFRQPHESPELKVMKMSSEMIKRIEDFFDYGIGASIYCGFLHKGKFYLILSVLQTSGRLVKIIVHDRSDNTYRDVVLRHCFPNITTFLGSEFWAFSPSLTASV